MMTVIKRNEIGEGINERSNVGDIRMKEGVCKAEVPLLTQFTG